MSEQDERTETSIGSALTENIHNILLFIYSLPDTFTSHFEMNT